MVSISPPQNDTNYSERALDCQEAIEPVLQDLIADAQVAGWGSAELFSAIHAVIEMYRSGAANDPDPAEEPIGNIPEIAVDDPTQGP